MAQRSWVFTGLANGHRDAFLGSAPRRDALRCAPGAFAAVWIAGLLLAPISAGCASGSPVDAGPGPVDTGPRIDANLDAGSTDAPMDAAASDTPRDVAAVSDAGSGCGTGPNCEGLTHCVGGTCVDYPPCRGDNTCPDPGDVCTARRCIPGTDDPDHDGSPASEDCDETDPTRNPRLPEICNLRDDNCNGAPDEGDPAQMCFDGDQSGICMAGVCSCPPGTFDFIRAELGCECASMPGVTEGVSCASGVDLGDFTDAGPGTLMNVSGNALPDGREVWYTFRAVDSPDTDCDNFHVRVQLLNNPGNAYEMAVFRGDCSTADCPGPMTDFSWATDMAPDPANLAGTTGECPCSAVDDRASVAGHVSVAGRNFCSDNTAQYNIRIRRVAGAPASCDAYTVEVSNGRYDT